MLLTQELLEHDLSVLRSSRSGVVDVAERSRLDRQIALLEDALVMYCKPQKRLIYYVCHGSAHHDLLRVSVESVRVAGGFRGTVRVYSDSSVDITGVDEVITVPSLKDWQEICASRFVLGSELPFNDYDEIAYLDNDILAVSHLDAVFSGMDKLRAMNEESTAMGSQFSTRGGLSAREKLAAMSRTSICDGMFAGSSQVVRNLMPIWRDVYAQTPAGKNRDQNALNALIFRGLVPFRGYESNVVAPGGEHAINTRSCLLHFWWDHKKWMPMAWREWKRRAGVASSDAGPESSTLDVGGEIVNSDEDRQDRRELLTSLADVYQWLRARVAFRTRLARLRYGNKPSAS